MTMIDTFTAEMSSMSWSPATHRLRSHQLARWARWLPCAVSSATRTDVIAYLGRSRNAETRASTRAALRGLYRWMVEEGHLATDPTMRLPRSPRPAGVPKPLPDAVFARVSMLATPREHAMLTIGRYAGLRAAEIGAVHRRDLIGDPGEERLLVLGKGSKERVVPAHPSVVDVVTATQGFVFPSQRATSGHLSGGAVTRILSDLLPTIWTAHSLRHAYATQAYRESGNDLRLVQQLLGHASPATTARYVLVSDDKAGRVVRGLHVPGAAVTPGVPGLRRVAA